MCIGGKVSLQGLRIAERRSGEAETKNKTRLTSAVDGGLRGREPRGRSPSFSTELEPVVDVQPAA